MISFHKAYSLERKDFFEGSIPFSLVRPNEADIVDDTGNICSRDCIVVGTRLPIIPSSLSDSYLIIDNYFNVKASAKQYLLSHPFIFVEEHKNALIFAEEHKNTLKVQNANWKKPISHLKEKNLWTKWNYVFVFSVKWVLKTRVRKKVNCQVAFPGESHTSKLRQVRTLCGKSPHCAGEEK